MSIEAQNHATDVPICLCILLEFYSLLGKVNSPLKNHIPDVLASGIIYLANGTYKIVPWDGKRVPDVIAKCNFIPEKVKGDVSPFGVWRKKQFEYRKAGVSTNESIRSAEYTRIWPYLITKRCKGKIYAELRDTLSQEDELNLASFLGEQLRYLHLLPHPPLDISIFSDIEQESDFPFTNGGMEAVPYKSNIPAEWDIFIRTLSKKKKNVSNYVDVYILPILLVTIAQTMTVVEFVLDHMCRCYCILHEENVLGAVFSLWDELKMAKSWEEVEQVVWGELIHVSLCWSQKLPQHCNTFKSRYL
ncbi:hypothetical protein RchiOBHm_Chr7g0242931 [Rosa chinensis]|uniref:Uncharacterized protein n=1 Tax=Rosa chinensis TaxID=74649 RepID=A0A2P6PIL5_ROSCH|nr:hypothetical protein RchiOBHm_Chr7g0242931 [Rosa chinensis]